MKLPPLVTWSLLFLVAVALVWPPTLAAAQAPADSTWPDYGNDLGGGRYSPLAQINRSNVAQLRVAWTHRTGALQPETPLNKKAAFEATPILVEGKLFLSTPFNQVIALDPGTGAKLWEHDVKLDRSRNYSEVTSRGVSAWVWVSGTVKLSRQSNADATNGAGRTARQRGQATRRARQDSEEDEERHPTASY